MSSATPAAVTTAFNQQNAGVILSVNIGSSSLKFSAHPVSIGGAKKTVAASILSGNIQGLEPGESLSFFGQKTASSTKTISLWSRMKIVLRQRCET